MKNNEDILAKAIEQLKNEQIPAGPPSELVDATLAQLRDAASRSQKESGRATGFAKSIGHTGTIIRLTTKLAAAAVLLIGLGYAIGRVSAPRPPDTEELLTSLKASLAASLEPAIRQKLLEEMNQRWQIALASSYLQLKDDLSQQYRRDLSHFAIQTLAASNTITNQRLEELIAAINAAQTQDRQWFATALSQIERNRRQDKNQLAAGLETLAVQTENQLQKTRQDMAQLLSYTQPDSIGTDKSNNLNNLNEGSK
jgi:hypothetical protein